MPSRPDVLALADRVGILREYRDVTGRAVRTTDATRVALLGAMGFDASSERRARRALTELEQVDGARLLTPVSVQTPRPSRAAHVELRCPEGVRAMNWRLEVTLESGGAVELSGARRRIEGRKALKLRLPADLPLGYHHVHLEAQAEGRAISARQSLILCPQSCWTWREAIGERRVCGLWTHLYTLRSRRNWGIGDLTDLARLAAWGASCGAEFIGLSPLHAIANRGAGISPYSPISRLFRNPIYLDVERVPEFRGSARARKRVGSPGFRQRLDRVRRMPSPESGGEVPYDLVISLKEEVLRPLFAEFKHRHMARPSARGRKYARYVEAGGRMLEDFATFMALADRLSFRRRRSADWRNWPAEMRDPRSPAVAQFKARFADDVEFHRYLQFETDRQVDDAHAAAQTAGMTLGLYHDLAVGSDGGGFDTWAAPSATRHQASPLFVGGATMGAPPDPMARDGQDWRFPPLHPMALRETGYDYWIRLLRANMRGGGMLRIDHVMGLFRQYWIPEGLGGRRGGYVRFPSDDLLGILALESRRSRVIVVGEDLGTVQPQVPRELKRRGILSTRVLHFERTRRGAFRKPGSISDHALLVAGTHDLPPIAGYLSGMDIRRRVIGRTLLDPAPSADVDLRAVRTLMRERRRDCDMLMRRLAAEGLLTPLQAEGLLLGDFSIFLTPEGKADTSRLPILVDAVHRFLARSPAPLVAVSLEDLVGEEIPLNIPGLPPESGFCWTRAMRVALEKLVGDAGIEGRVSRVAAELRGRR
ncbi:MAG: 4-alpha-glucanotransferase [Phycisphaerales bacterium]|nr:4-alpha-glucanotransferase [Phycisphaerales bacterium]